MTTLDAAVKWGILSTANINRKVIPGAHASEKVELIAVASRDLRRAEEYAREWEIDRAYGSYEALLEDADVEAVYISLPNTLHCEWSIRALEAGKHVLCEKPMSRHVGDVEAAFDAAAKAQRILMEAFMYRHNPQTRRLRQLVGEGAIGDLRLVRSCFSYSLYDAENIRLRTEVEGGSLMDVGCYCVSAARMLAGEPVSVTAQQLRAPSGVERRLVATLAHGGDVLSHFDCALDLADRSDLEVAGSEGSLRVSDPWHSRQTGIDLVRDDGHGEHFDIPAADPYGCELDDLAGAIAGDHPPRLGVADALGQARTIHALYAAAASGRQTDV
jgi:D-xylose 1-dehydrogenase (NADP+, D-xylono-1,5-lactone-forming)